MARKWKRVEIVRLSITLVDSYPRVARRIDIDSDTDLFELHWYIQAAMGWEDCHLWAFEARRHGHRKYWSPDIENPDEIFDDSLQDILEYLGIKREFFYLYDFGDKRRHVIRVGKPQPPRDDRRYPYLVSGTGRCPPEDIGGMWGYDDFLKAWEDPSSSYRKHYPGWFDGSQTWDPEDGQLDERRASLARYSKLALPANAGREDSNAVRLPDACGPIAKWQARNPRPADSAPSFVRGVRHQGH